VSRRASRRAVAAAVVGAVLLTACSVEDPAPAPAAAEEELDGAADPDLTDESARLTGRAPLTGVPIADEAAVELDARPLLIAKIENSPQARPQAGLDTADVVVEELVEGGMTRFIALFHSDLPDDVGPVRSARPVDVTLGSGFGRPVFAHSGARATVQSELRASALVAFEEGGPGFHRVPERRSPHDLFVRPSEVVAAGRELGATPPVAPGWAFAEDAPAGAVTCSPEDASCDEPGETIRVPMSTSATTGWTYDETAGVYRRDQDGAPSVVTGEGRIGAANVVVLATHHYTDGCCDTNGAPYAETSVVGEDDAIVLRDGQRFAATWRKTEADAPLELLAPDGGPFALKPGPTWILLPSSSVVAGL
jgi:hypothetical protein